MGFISAIFKLLFQTLILGLIVFAIAHLVMSQNYTNKVTVKYEDGTNFEMPIPEGWYNHNETALGKAYHLVRKDLPEGAFITPKDCGILCAANTIIHSLQKKFYKDTAFIQLLKITNEKPVELCKTPERKFQDTVSKIPGATVNFCLRNKDEASTLAFRVISDNKNELLVTAFYFNDDQVEPLLKAVREMMSNVKISKAE